MSLLQKEPLLLCHFDSTSNGNYFGGVSSATAKIGNDTSKSKFGDASLKLNPFTSTDPNYKLLVTLKDKFDFASDFTLSYYKYTNSLANNLNGNGASTTFYMSFTSLYIRQYDSSYICENVKGNPASQWIDSSTLYSASNDVGKWVHMEMSYTASTRTLRYFRNGLIIVAFVLDGDFYNPTPIIVNIFDDINISELLVTKDCLHTANFTPPTEPYSWYNIKNAYRDIPTNKLHGYK